MITLHLSGYLAELHGEEVRLEVKTAREAVSFLSYQCPKYRQHLRGHTWWVFFGKKDEPMSLQSLDLRIPPETDVWLEPAIEGSSGSWRDNAIIGGVLLVASIFVAPWATPWLIGGGVGFLSTAVNQRALAGLDDLNRDPVDQRPSFLFSGPKNTASQGTPLPMGYGRMLVGSQVISVALYAEDTSA